MADLLTDDVQPVYLTTQMAAKLVGLSMRSIQFAAARGEIRRYKFGTAVRFRRDHIIAWAERHVEQKTDNQPPVNGEPQ